MRCRRPAKPGGRASSACAWERGRLGERTRPQAIPYTLHVSGALREVLAADQIVMLKTLRCPARVVWVCRKTQSGLP
jgi:hypothetical protein